MTDATRFCDLCGHSYTADIDTHLLFCEAMTCAICMTTQNHVLPPNSWGMRVCYECSRRDDVDLLYSGMIDEEENDDGFTQA